MTESLHRIVAYTEDRLISVAPDLHDLPDIEHGWCRWPHWPGGIVRRVDDKRWVGVIPFIYTDAIVWGFIGDTTGYMDRWCYDSATKAIIHATAWDGASDTEPDGWHRHPRSGRRRENGDPTTEYVNP